MKRPGHYSQDEVSYLLANYQELRPQIRRRGIHVRLIDIDRAVARLPIDQRVAVFLHGYAALPLRRAAEIIGVTHVEVSRRYWEGVHAMTAFLNGGE